MQKKSINMIFIDYMLLMSSSNDANTRVEELIEIVYGLKWLANELNIAVVAVTPLSPYPKCKPELKDFREYGFALEEMVDLIVFLHTERTEQNITLIRTNENVEKSIVF